MRISKIFAGVSAAVLALTLTACGTGNEKTENKDGGAAAMTTGEINVVSREEGSGTRGAFTEIVGVEREIQVDGKTEKEDATYEEAIFQDGTNKVITTVSGDDRAIGYISLGSLNDTVKAVKINGVDANHETVQSGEYKIQRPFLFVYKDENALSDIAKDFIKFALSKDGQAILGDEFITIDPNAPAYEKTDGLSGKISITGSTSVGPLAKKMAEAYKGINPDVAIEIQETGSGTGIKEATAGNVDIGMSSRELKEDEAKVLKATEIAKDGIAVIVAKSNSTEDITLDNVREIFLGNIRNWEDVK